MLSWSSRLKLNLDDFRWLAEIGPELLLNLSNGCFARLFFNDHFRPITHTRNILVLLSYAFKRGAAPESIQRAFPLLTLEEIYGAITFYLAHVQDIDTYLAQAEAEFAVQASALNAAARTTNPALSNVLSTCARPARRLPNDRPLPG